MTCDCVMTKSETPVTAEPLLWAMSWLFHGAASKYNLYIAVAIEVATIFYLSICR